MTDNTAAALTQEPKVTYGHCNDTVHKVRFSQFAKDPLPVWAVDVQPETEPAASVADTLGQQCAEAETALHRVLAATAQLQPRTLDAPVSDAEVEAAYDTLFGSVFSEKSIDDMRRALEAFKVARTVAQPALVRIPGWRLVPMPPTPVMRKAACFAYLDCGSMMLQDKVMAAVFAAIAAAPTPPKGEPS